MISLSLTFLDDSAKNTILNTGWFHLTFGTQASIINIGCLIIFHSFVVFLVTTTCSFDSTHPEVASEMGASMLCRGQN